MKHWLKWWDVLSRTLVIGTEDKQKKELDDMQMLQQAKEELFEAQNLFARVEDPDMVEAAIYSLTAAEKRYNYLIKRCKQIKQQKSETVLTQNTYNT